MRPILFRLGKLRLPGPRGAPPLLHRLPPGSLPPAPFSQSDWPNPRALAGLQPWTAQNLLGTTLAIQAPFRQRDWPSPPQPAPPLSSLRTWTQNHLLDTLAAAAAAAAASVVFRDPLVTRYGLPRGTPVQDFVNLLPTLLGQVAPFRQPDWPNPRALAGLQPWTAQNLLTGTLFRPPFSQRDWPNPRGPVPAPATWLDTYKVLLFQETIPSLNLDWPVPPGPRAAIQSLLVNLLQTTLSAAAPFGQQDWPVPPGRPRVVDLLTWIQRGGQQGLTDTFFGLAGHPTFEWPNPRGPVSPAVGFLVNLLASTLSAIPVPFSQQDWPNPKGPVSVAGLTTWLETYKLLLFREQIPSLNRDWPNPGVPARSLSLLTHVVNLLITPGVQPPFTPLAWPNPQARAIATVGWLLNLLESTLTPSTQAPFRLNDWPNPQTPRSLVYIPTHERVVFVPVAGPMPFVWQDWPNPRPTERVIDLRTWLQDLLASTLAPVVAPPFHLLDWPNPRGQESASILRTWIESLDLLLLGKDQFFGAPGQPPANMNWPNPRPPADIVALRTLIQVLQQVPPTPSVRRLLRMLMGIGR